MSRAFGVIFVAEWGRSDSVGDGNPFSDISAPVTIFTCATLALSTVVEIEVPTATWIVEADPTHLFFIRFGLALMERGISEIQACPECARVFYRVRKQKYCSKTCINRVSRRNWLNKPRTERKTVSGRMKGMSAE